MDRITSILTTMSNWAWYSSSHTGDYVNIAVYSVISAVFFLFIFKTFSNQEKIREHKKKIVGYLLQIRLYRDRLGVVLLSILSILKHNVLYIRYTLSSLVIIIIPLFIISMQINSRAGYEPMRPGQRFIIGSEIDATRVSKNVSEILSDVGCSTSSGIVIETLPLRIPGEASVFWRASVRPDAKSGKARIQIGLKDDETKSNPPQHGAVKTIFIDAYGEALSPRLEKINLWSVLMYGAEGFLPETSPIAAISVTYQRATYPFLFWDVDAIILYLILTLVSAFALKPLMKVSI